MNRTEALAKLAEARRTVDVVRGDLVRLGAYEPLLTAKLCDEAADRLKWVEGRIRNPDGLVEGEDG